jgi:outer membrane protein OmpA-like peptidoglycan-associated protein
MRNIAPVQRQIDLVVSFDFDSDRLQPDSKPLLESLAQAINSERLQGLRFMVEGHTDAKGSARYNELLSARRAHSVVQFLRSQGVLPQRLEAQGRGFQDLLNKDQPEAAENRRVRIVTLAQ